MRKQLVTILRDARGNMALEFALLLPAILILLGGIIEFGSAMYASSAMESAARAGAHYAFEKGLDKPGIEAAVKGASTYPPPPRCSANAPVRPCPATPNAREAMCHSSS
jgi:hypothetical protein